ncbi:GHKL domain-containing protein [Enterococcus hulanensis]|uniref:GHKL domain-containing protein n=1 Tax=Enterococcus hulanensis TaxID=2559929 RepID=UPI00288D7ABF|nr:GHKL domain-containing protein [Enterococcus hulanensis]MDT2660508.1 GHKL domain-containing protein [Enterococcus hulanensis]
MIAESFVFLFLFEGKEIIIQYFFLGRFIVDIVLVICTRIWNHYLNNKYTRVVKTYSLGLVLLPVMSVFVLHYLISLDSNTLTLRSLIECIFIFALNLFVFLLIDQVFKSEEVKREKIVYEEQLKYYEQYNNQLENNQIRIDMLSHDFKNHLISMAGYIKQKNFVALEQYMAEIMLNDSINEITGCVIVDALIHFYGEKFKVEGIKLHVNTEIPNHLPYDSSDISVILGNLFQNSYEELSSAKNIVDKNISFTLKFYKNRLIIIMENTFETKLKRNSKESLVSTKSSSHSKKRGLGIRSIKRAASKYDHIVDIETNNNIFTVTVVLFVPLNKKEPVLNG